MPDIDNKIVSISFNNKQFLKDIDQTMDAILKFNNATSGKNIDTSGLESLKKAFQTTTSGVSKDAESLTTYLTNISKAANTKFETGGIDSLRKALENTGTTAVDVEDTITALQQLSKTGVSYASDIGVSNAQSAASAIQQESNNTRSVLTQDVDDISSRFSMLRMIGMGAMIAIGERATNLGMNLIHQFNGISDGWQEYNSLTNSTQTILANTERYGTTMQDVSQALGELNKYADLTTYAFSDMTRNIGYFTTAGVNLEDSVTAIKGLSNVGALFGADAQSVARAGYQMSQAMSAGVIRLMDWRSMVNAGMGGQVLQDELIKTAAIMSGTSVDAMNAYIDGLGGFNQSLQEGWLTSDVFLETLRKFAGQSREYYEQLTDEQGNRLYSDEEIDQMVRLGETALDSATKVRTFRQMMDAFKESIGSGWQQTFSLIIGNLEEAKEFWTPINDILTSLVNGFFDLQNGALESWRSWGGREELLAGIQNVLSNISGILTAIGNGFVAAFGGSWAVGPRLYGITEALTDLTEALMLSDEEIGYVKDLFEGLFQPIRLIVDILFELGMALFNSGDAAGQMEQSADSLYGGIKRFKTSVLQVLGYIGSILTAGANFIRQNELVKKVVRVLAQVISKSFGIISRVIAAPFILFYDIWERYNIGGKIEEFWYKVVEYFMPIADAVTEVKNVFESWFRQFKLHLTNIGLWMKPIEYVSEMFDALKQLFRDLLDPTVTIREAFSNFVDTLSNGNIGRLLEEIKNGFGNLWDQLKDTTLGQWFTDLKDRIQNAWESLSQTPFGQWIGGIIDNIKEFIGINTGKWDTFWDTTETVVTSIADSIATGWGKIKTFFSELIDIFKDWFGISDQAQESTEALEDSAMGAVGDGPFAGQIASSATMMEIISQGIITTAENINKAEKMIPEPSESKFLAFLRSIPDSISGLVDTISHSKIIKNIKEFFILLGTSISSFFNQDLHEQGNDILSFFGDRIEDVESLIGKLLGIEDFSFGEYGIFETIAATIASFINAFNKIDAKALLKIQGVVAIIGQVVGMFIQLEIASTIGTFTAGLYQAASGYKKAQAAAKSLADAAKIGAIGSLLLTFGLVLLEMLAIILLVAGMIQNGQGPYLALGFAVILLTLSMIMAFIEHISDQANNKKYKAGVINSIAKMVENISKILLTIVISIGALIAIAALTTLVYWKMKDAGLDGAFIGLLIGIGALFVVLTAAIGVLAGFILKSVNKTDSAVSSFKSSGIAKAFESIAGILTSIGLLILMLSAAVAGLAFTIKYVGSPGALIGAIAIVGVMLAVAIGAVAGLIAIANTISSTTSTVDPKVFRKTIFSLAILLGVVIVGVVALMGAVAGMVMIMSNTENYGRKIILATSVIIGFIFTIGVIITMMTLAVSKIKNNKDSKVLRPFMGIIGILVTIGILVGALAFAASVIANNTNSLKTLVGTLLSIGGLFVIVLASVWGLAAMISSIDMRKITDKKMKAVSKLIDTVTSTMVVISASLSLLAFVMGSTGFLTNGGSIMSVMAAMTIMYELIAVTIGIMAALLKYDVISTDGITKVAGSMLLASMAFVAIAGSMGLLATLVDKMSLMWTAMGVISILTAVLMGSLIALTAISKSNISAVMVSALSMLAASTAFLIMGDAITRIADIDTGKLWTAMGVLTIMTLAMGGIMIALSAIGKTGMGIGAIAIAAGAILALGASYLMMGTAIEKFGSGLEKTVNAVERFSGAVNSLKNIDLTGIRTKISGLLSIAKDTAVDLVSVAKTLGNAAMIAISSMINGVMVGFLSGIGNGLLSIRDFIMNYAPSIVEAFTYLGLLMLNSIHTTAEEFVKMVNEDFGPGGMVRSIIETLEDFVEWLSENVFGWGLDIVDAALTGLITAISNQSKIQIIALKLEQLVLSIYKNLMDLLGIPNFGALGAQIVLDMMEGLTNAVVGLINHGGAGVAGYIAEAFGFDAVDALTSFADTLGTAADMAGTDAWDSSSIGGQISDIADEINRINAAAERTATAYNPTEYYRNIANDAEEAAESSNGFFDGIGSKIRNLLGISEDFSLSDMLGGFNLGEMLGGGGLSSLSSLTDSFSGLSDSMGGMTSMSSILDMSPDQVTQLSGSLGGVTDVFNADAFTNPVITPTVDTSGVAFGIDSIEQMFNNANISDFAIDAGNSILTAERTNGNAATDGGVTQNFTYTQTINHAGEASPIQIYRDTNALLRGHVG